MDIFGVSKGPFVAQEKSFCSRYWSLLSTSNTSLWNLGSKMIQGRSTSNQGFAVILLHLKVIDSNNYDILNTLTDLANGQLRYPNNILVTSDGDILNAFLWPLKHIRKIHLATFPFSVTLFFWLRDGTEPTETLTDRYF